LKTTGESERLRNHLGNRMPPARGKVPQARFKGKIEARGKHVTGRGGVSTKDASSGQLPLDLQQLVLNIFAHAFPIDSNQLPLTLQQIKKSLYDRDFSSAFGHQDLRETYAQRWSPSRALAYLHIFWKYLPLLPDLKSEARAYREGKGRDEGGVMQAAEETLLSESCLQTVVGTVKDREPRQVYRKIVCLGGGAGAELVALAAYLHNLEANVGADLDLSNKPPRLNDASACFECRLIDIADWDSLIRMLQRGTTTAPPISKYASAEAKATNHPLVSPDRFAASFMNHDMLSMEPGAGHALFEDAALVTLMFTLNELYSKSMSSTTQFLLSLTSSTPVGALLLVVDSSGTYSTVNIGKDPAARDTAETEVAGPTDEICMAPSELKKYPMQWLLDHTLLDVATVNKSAIAGKAQKSGKDPKWEKVAAQDSEWFRLNPGLTYPIELEDMRYQMHLYRRL